MTFTISNAHNEARLNGTLSFLDNGPGNAHIQVYAGTRPANGADASGSTLLVDIVLDKPAGVVAGGALTLSSSAAPMCMASGTAAWARVLNAADQHVGDCNVSETGGAGQVQLQNVALQAGGRVELTSGVLG